ncbi:hypothetical protein IW245_002320 [Longispora fulva]|uniref:Uncharacterized protein n=1 Tax=Longispora fulva TaxID=619741 RepID=A0A8J7GSB6_9ACTN|nr:hypothetical protein [Longispora fulva]
MFRFLYLLESAFLRLRHEKDLVGVSVRRALDPFLIEARRPVR